MQKNLSYSFMFSRSINSCIQIHSSYNPFSNDFGYKKDLYCYGSKHRKLIKDKYNLLGIVEDHHIIPKSFEKHQLISETKFPIHCSKNIKMMPSIHNDIISDNILIHMNHHKYNLFIKDKLDEMYETMIELEDRQLNIYHLICELNIKLNYKNLLPWN